MFPDRNCPDMIAAVRPVGDLVDSIQTIAIEKTMRKRSKQIMIDCNTHNQSNKRSRLGNIEDQPASSQSHADEKSYGVQSAQKYRIFYIIRSFPP